MKIVHASQMMWGENLAAHRAGGIQHKVLFEGEEGSPDNFLLVLAKEGSEYFSPRHRHPWDQVRYCIEGSVPVGRDLAVDAGEVAYFPEGVPYGPQEGGGDRIELLLQFGGASGLGYLSAAQVKRAHAELARDGVFEGGAYKRGGKNTDAYEAIWQHVTGKPLVYPAPRYKAPIVMRPDAFAWRPADPGSDKYVGQFPDRGLTLFVTSFAAGESFLLWNDISQRFGFVRSGSGRCGRESYEPHTVISLESKEEITLSAKTDTEVLVISVRSVVPKFQKVGPGHWKAVS